MAVVTDPWGHVTEEDLGNGLTTTRSFDPTAGFLTGITTGIGAGTGIQELDYQWDLLGNLAERHDARLVLEKLICVAISRSIIAHRY